MAYSDHGAPSQASAIQSTMCSFPPIPFHLCMPLLWLFWLVHQFELTGKEGKNALSSVSLGGTQVREGKGSGESHSHSSSWWTSDTCTLVCQSACTKFQAHRSKCCPMGISKTAEMKLLKKEKGKRRNRRRKVIPALCKQNDPVGSMSITLPSTKEHQKKTHCNSMHLEIRNCDEYWPNWTLWWWQTYLWSFLSLINLSNWPPGENRTLAIGST